MRGERERKVSKVFERVRKKRDRAKVMMRIELIGKHAVGNITVDRSEQLTTTTTTTTIEMK